MSLTTPIPNGPFYSLPSNSVSTPQGNLVLGYNLSVTQDGTLLVSSALGGTVSQIDVGTGLSGGIITTTGSINLLPATNASLGGIKVGNYLTISPDGTLSAYPPNPGTISSITTGTGLSGGGVGPAVTITLNAASKTSYGGVTVGNGIDVTSGQISLTAASTTQLGGVTLATPSEVITGSSNTKAVTPAGLAAKVATTLVPGIVRLSDSVAISDSTKAATQTAAFTAYTAATAAQATASAALPKSGGTMTGVITFAPGQAFPGVALPKATANSLGVISVGPGLSVNSSGVLSTANNGTVTGVTAGIGLGAPGSGNTISTSGTLNLLAPTTNGLTLGGVKTGASNPHVSIAFDGTITVGGFLSTNNPYAYDGYIFPAPDSFGFTPGSDGQVLTIADKTSGTLAWASTGTLSSVVAGTGISVNSTVTSATVSLAPIPSLVTGNFGGTALIPTLTINQYGQVTSTGLANPFASFSSPTVTAPFNLVLDFAGNNTNKMWTLNGNTTIQNPLNAVSGQRGSLLITQAPSGVGPYLLTWGSAWRFPNNSPFTGGASFEVTLIDFVVVAGNDIIVTAVVPNIG